MKHVCIVYRVTVEQLMSDVLHIENKDVVEARRMYWYLLTLRGMTIMEIVIMFRTTYNIVYKGVSTVENLIDVNKQTKRKYNEINRRFQNHYKLVNKNIKLFKQAYVQK